MLAAVIAVQARGLAQHEVDAASEAHVAELVEFELVHGVGPGVRLVRVPEERAGLEVRVQRVVRLEEDSAVPLLQVMHEWPNEVDGDKLVDHAGQAQLTAREVLDQAYQRLRVELRLLDRAVLGHLHRLVVLELTDLDLAGAEPLGENVERVAHQPAGISIEEAVEIERVGRAPKVERPPMLRADDTLHRRQVDGRVVAVERGEVELLVREPALQQDLAPQLDEPPMHGGDADDGGGRVGNVLEPRADRAAHLRRLVGLVLLQLGAQPLPALEDVPAK